jgi:hypothetical protein
MLAGESFHGAGRASDSEVGFDREAWREGLEELDPAARAAMAALAAKRERPNLLDIGRMVAGLGAAAEIEDQIE